MKFLKTYLRNYALKYKEKPTNILNEYMITNEYGKISFVTVSEYILFSEAANRIEELENKLKELERIDKIIKIYEGEN